VNPASGGFAPSDVEVSGPSSPSRPHRAASRPDVATLYRPVSQPGGGVGGWGGFGGPLGAAPHADVATLYRPVSPSGARRRKAGWGPGGVGLVWGGAGDTEAGWGPGRGRRGDGGRLAWGWKMGGE
jgi:hypothetical protein